LPRGTAFQFVSVLQAQTGFISLVYGLLTTTFTDGDNTPIRQESCRTRASAPGKVDEAREHGCKQKAATL
jgi:hypothetical protein